MIPKFQIENWDRNSIDKVYRPREGVSRHAQIDTFARLSEYPGNVPPFAGGRGETLKRAALKTKHAWFRSL